MNLNTWILYVYGYYFAVFDKLVLILLEPGLPKPNFSWTKKESKWTRNGTNFLTISSLKFEDAGIYGCRLYNKLGSSRESSYTLYIEGSFKKLFFVLL